MPAWESLLRITPASSWGTAGTIGNRGLFLYADSESLDRGEQIVERDTKFLGLRESPADTFSIDRYFPRGEFIFQPRVDDLLMIAMAHFQNVVKSGIGTYTFYRLPTPLKWTEGGSNIGTHPYSINVDLCFGQSFITAGGTMANGIRFMNGIVDQLRFEQRYTEDLRCTPTFKFLAGSLWVYPSTFGYPSVYGSMSAYTRFVDYHGTLTITGKSYDVEAWQGLFINNSADRARLGKRGYTRFPFTGKWIADGSFDLELSDDLAEITPGGTNALTVDFFQAAGNQLLISQPNIYRRAYTIPLTDGNALIDLSIPYRAYPPNGTTGPSTQLTIYTGSCFGTVLGTGWGSAFFGF